MAETDTILSVRDLRKSFDGNAIHRGISFNLERGEVMGIMGVSGSGKSLLLKQIIGLEMPDSGEVVFERIHLTRLKERQLFPIRTQIGYVFQYGALFDSLTLQENLEYPLRKHTRLSDEEIRNIVNEQLARVDMQGTNALLPAQLSGGMQKRAGLARATILAPKLVLFDEPTSGLDPINVRRFLGNMKKIRQTRRVSALFVSHDIASLAAIADRIAFIRDGRIYAIGTTDEICRSNDAFVREFTNTNYRESIDGNR